MLMLVSFAESSAAEVAAFSRAAAAIPGGTGQMLGATPTILSRGKPIPYLLFDV